MQLTPYSVKKNPHFKGRAAEQQQLLKLSNTGSSKIVVIYGRRRVGKTELIEQTLAERDLLKFEGLERQPKSKQIKSFIQTLATYARDPLITKLAFTDWLEVFQYLATLIQRGRWTLYLEELQWLANYQNELMSSFKHVWDNQLRHNKDLLVVLCGSAPSFMINKVLHSSALYNRTEESLVVHPFSLSATKAFLGKGYSNFETMDALLTVGAIPPYIEKLRSAPSIITGLAKNCFVKESYFVQEYERIFTSSMARNPAYKKTLEFLASRAYANRQEIAKACGLSTGGGLAALLQDLEQTGFIQSYSPLDKELNSKSIRYQITDAYIQFYLKFMKPILGRIQKGQYDELPERALDKTLWAAWLGLSFERWVRANAAQVAKILGFNGIEYDAGAYFSKATPKIQIDLLFERADKVVTIVETKYTREPVGSNIIKNFERKCALYPLKSKSVRKVLISASGASNELVRRGYFDQIITLDDFT